LLLTVEQRAALEAANGQPINANRNLRGAP